MSEEIPRYVEGYLGLVLKRKKIEALAYLSDIVELKKLGLLDMFHILAGAQEKVGSLWANGSITVADEHYTTEATLEAIELLSNKIKKFQRDRVGFALIANFVEGEYHTVGLRMFSELLKSHGWDVQFFAMPLHVASLFKYLETAGKKFDLICCSVTMEFNIEELKSILKILKTNVQTRNVKILVGSHLFDRSNFVEKFTDEETKQSLADYLAKDFDSGIEYVRNIKPHQ
jgi:methanogenic corrinoid protein MtbC1